MSYTAIAILACLVLLILFYIIAENHRQRAADKRAYRAAYRKGYMAAQADQKHTAMLDIAAQSMLQNEKAWAAADRHKSEVDQAGQQQETTGDQSVTDLISTE